MTPEDPRHGTYAGAAAHWKDGEKPCPPCHEAAYKVRKKNTFLTVVGNSATVPSRGTVRRIQALQAIGWTQREIAEAAGVPVASLRNPVVRGSRVYRATADAVARAFDKLAMTPAPESRNSRYLRTVAAREGHASPLAWDDIDHDEHPAIDAGDHEQADEVLIDRFLAGDRMETTFADRVGIAYAWRQSGRSISSLERETGWNVHRLLREADKRQDGGAA